jgi:RNA polymerase sigma-70 factor (ECF subfamily)
VREPQRLSGFIAGLAKNLALNYARRETRRGTPVDLEIAQEIPDQAPGPLDRLLERERAAKIRQVLEELDSERDREILFRFYIAEERKEQICEALGLSRLHFNRVLYRAKQRYKELYEKLVDH